MKFIILIILLLIPLDLHATPKNEIKKKLQNTNNIYFNFIQKIGEKTEKGICKISYPKKIYCKYDDIYEKILVSDGKSLIINSKKIKNYLIYKLKDTPLNLILDKNFLITKLEKVEKIQENNETFFFKIEQNNNLIIIFFDKNDYNVKGWKSVDIYQNQVETKLLNIKSNVMLDQTIFRIQKYIN